MAQLLEPLPILYSLRFCPYAMRARLGLLANQHTFILREVNMSHLPMEMISCSSKSTVPVLQLPDEVVIDESLDILLWSYSYIDHCTVDQRQAQLQLVQLHDNEFIPNLDRYKIAARYHHADKDDYRIECYQLLIHLNQKLQNNRYLSGGSAGLADYAILPFVRQFSRVERRWFKSQQLDLIEQWLSSMYQTPIYHAAMLPHVKWQPGTEENIISAIKVR
ncbi:hypothetical protein BCU68_13055 [Vibrio sp. 10N.286.49.B3]|uniref:glutathione S-transferase n=1 Tax=Vibrio sp. 10N.286.49.B3 TaxID=1880855 RepID=UPI000C83EB79|nr:glutathione S-transferase [Vibrio sp. 10N.286.49.B3]PMH43773.1 hypothetical protein BCU68_13055 [Vibrio sp. 10N.286.49.B3]